MIIIKEYESESRIKYDIFFEKIIVKAARITPKNNNITINFAIDSLIAFQFPSLSHIDTYFVNPKGTPTEPNEEIMPLKFSTCEIIPIPTVPKIIA